MRALPLLLIVTLLAGCASDAGTSGALVDRASSETRPGAPVSAPATVDVAEGVGAIEGLVTDDEMMPIVAALIQMHPAATPDENTFELRTDDLGVFGLTGLKPDAYMVYVSKPGYKAFPPKRVEVGDGPATQVKVVLVRLPAQVPIHDTKTFSWRPDYAYAYQVPSASNLGGNHGSGSGGYVVNETEKGQLRTIIIEATWTDSGPCTTHVKTGIYSPDHFYNLAKGGQPRPGDPAINPFYWHNLPNVTNPTKLYLPREGTGRDAMQSSSRQAQNLGQPLRLEGPWSMAVSLYGKEFQGQSTVQFGCALGTKFDVWHTFFFVADAPSREWTALKG